MEPTVRKNQIQSTREHCDKARNEQQKSMLLSEVSKLHVQKSVRLKHLVEKAKADVQSVLEKLEKGIWHGPRKAG